MHDTYEGDAKAARPLLPPAVVPEEHGPERRQAQAGPQRGSSVGAGVHRGQRYHCDHG